MSTKGIFNILLYASLAFLVIYLVRFDYFQIKEIRFDLVYLFLSIAFLWAGFYLSTLSWWKGLHLHKMPISKKLALSSHGMAVFAKYIPGKIWVILGRASKAAGEKYSVEAASFVSLKEQLLYVWLGLLLSSVPLVIFYGNVPFTWGVLALFIGLSIFNFWDRVRRSIIWSIKKVFRKELELPLIDLRRSFVLLFYILIYWVAWILAFYFFSKSLYPDSDLLAGLIFPMSVSIGLLALFAPGGIGVREGIMTAFLVMLDFPIEIATAIAIISRLWFMSGEVFIFFLGLFVNKSLNKLPNSAQKS